MENSIVDSKYNGDYSAWLQDFSVRVKRAYPQEKVLHNLIEQNSVLALRGLLLLRPDPKAIKLHDELLHTWRSNGLQR